MEERQRYYLATFFVSGLGPRTVIAERSAGFSIEEIVRKHTNEITIRRDQWNTILEYIKTAEKNNYSIITWDDETYPESLRLIADPPLVLFVKGTFEIARHIAVVGSRMMTAYGMSITEDVTRALVQRNCVVVSGFMRGVDTIAHRTTVKDKGKTIAVLGSGFLHPVPPENAPLIDVIVESGGAIISEFLPDQLGTKYTFPQRNRIVAGLSETVFVIEAGAKSGALITARYAGEQGKQVFAVPGSLYSAQSAGCHWLISQGASVVLSVDSVFEELGFIKSESLLAPELFNDLEKEVCAVLQHQQLHKDEIIRTLGKPTHEILSTLVTLELRGVVKCVGEYVCLAG